jgi:hypothetical protein
MCKDHKWTVIAKSQEYVQEYITNWCSVCGAVRSDYTSYMDLLEYGGKFDAKVVHEGAIRLPERDQG